MKKQLPSKEKLNEMFSYDIDSGRLIWKHRKDVRSGWNSKFPGKIAGSVLEKSYFVVSIKNKTFYQHQIVWVMHHGDIPDGMFTDHKDGNGLNNRIENLRLATHQQNCMNRKSRGMHKKGVFKNKKGLYQASICIDGKKEILGKFDSELVAAVAYKEKSIELFGEFACYDR